MVFEDVMHRARSAFQSGRTKDVAFRRQQLENLLRLYEENKDEMAAALAADLRRPKQEAFILEIDFLINDLTNTLIHLDEWSKDEKVCIICLHDLETCFIFFFTILFSFLCFDTARKSSDKHA
jgi:acyl-CoA reductase-like NAD-dependent aldehyde dehydrogenase